jgi:hypothetical protein
MKGEFIPYELALRLGSLGFDEPCIAWYVSKPYGLEYGKVIKSDLIKSAVLAPTWRSAFRWFREIKEVEYQITYAGAKGRYNAFVEDYFYNNGDLKEFTYEEAELACLEKLIEIVESKSE